MLVASPDGEGRQSSQSMQNGDTDVPPTPADLTPPKLPKEDKRSHTNVDLKQDASPHPTRRRPLSYKGPGSHVQSSPSPAFRRKRVGSELKGKSAKAFAMLVGQETTDRNIVDELSFLHHNDSADDEDASISARVKVCREVVTSEIQYCKNLKNIQTCYARPLLREEILTVQEHSSLFNLVEMIAQFHESILRELSKNQEGNLAGVFIRHADQFRCYSPYIKDYEQILARFNRLMETKPDFEKFVYKQGRDMNRGLMSLFILPVQRLPRYELLLRELSRETPETHEHYSDIMTALEKVRATIIWINETKRAAEEKDQTLSVEHMILGDDAPQIAVPGRIFIKSSQKLKSHKMRKLLPREKALRACILHLFNDILVHCDSHNHFLDRYSIATCVVTPNPGILKNPARGFQLLDLATDVNPLVVSAKTAETAQEWITILTETIKKQKKKAVKARRRRKALHQGSLKEDIRAYSSSPQGRRRGRSKSGSFAKVKSKVLKKKDGQRSLSRRRKNSTNSLSNFTASTTGSWRKSRGNAPGIPLKIDATPPSSPFTKRTRSQKMIEGIKKHLHSPPSSPRSDYVIPRMDVKHSNSCPTPEQRNRTSTEDGTKYEKKADKNLTDTVSSDIPIPQNVLATLMDSPENCTCGKTSVKVSWEVANDSDSKDSEEPSKTPPTPPKISFFTIVSMDGSLLVQTPATEKYECAFNNLEPSNIYNFVVISHYKTIHSKRSESSNVIRAKECENPTADCPVHPSVESSESEGEQQELVDTSDTSFLFISKLFEKLGIDKKYAEVFAKRKAYNLHDLSVEEMFELVPEYAPRSNLIAYLGKVEVMFDLTPGEELGIEFVDGGKIQAVRNDTLAEKLGVEEGWYVIAVNGKIADAKHGELGKTILNAIENGPVSLTFDIHEAAPQTG